ncbi:hypothetical protein QY883_05755 [Pediococcus acidilactici]|nr:hypothetical protein [Pediococcus acidilactici]MDQ7762317.1 hypothetical protein [Pediococcus acidilactici]UZO83228.1 hypothetical protein HPK31_07480 [Pediococcus acidilactici]
MGCQNHHPLVVARKKKEFIEKVVNETRALDEKSKDIIIYNIIEKHSND